MNCWCGQYSWQYGSGSVRQVELGDWNRWRPNNHVDGGLDKQMFECTLSTCSCLYVSVVSSSVELWVQNECQTDCHVHMDAL